MNRILLASALAFVVASWASVGGQQKEVVSGLSRTDAVSGLSRTYCETCHNDRLKTGGLSLQGLPVDGNAET